MVSGKKWRMIIVALETHDTPKLISCIGIAWWYDFLRSNTAWSGLSMKSSDIVKYNKCRCVNIFAFTPQNSFWFHRTLQFVYHVCLVCTRTVILIAIRIALHRQSLLWQLVQWFYFVDISNLASISSSLTVFKVQLLHLRWLSKLEFFCLEIF